MHLNQHKCNKQLKRVAPMAAKMAAQRATPSAAPRGVPRAAPTAPLPHLLVLEMLRVSLGGHAGVLPVGVLLQAVRLVRLAVPKGGAEGHDEGVRDLRDISIGLI